MFYESSTILSKNISGFEIGRVEGGELLSGHVEQLFSGTKVTVLGDGFDNRTVRVQSNGGLYFVFLRDIEEPDSSYYLD